jgi:hypothetical protein
MLLLFFLTTLSNSSQNAGHSLLIVLLPLCQGNTMRG